MPFAVPPDQPSPDTFGAPKDDFGESEDPSSEVAAKEYNALAATVCALARPGLKAWVAVSSAGALLDWDSVWGKPSSGPYVPLIANPGTGQYTVTVPGQVPDLLDGSLHSWAPRGSKAGANTDQRGATSSVAGSVVTVKTYSLSGGAAAASAFLVEIF